LAVAASEDRGPKPRGRARLQDAQQVAIFQPPAPLLDTAFRQPGRLHDPLDSGPGLASVLVRSPADHPRRGQQVPAGIDPALAAVGAVDLAVPARALRGLQRAGSFKFRGAYNALASLSGACRQRGVIGASSGNHAQALALAGRLLAVPVTVVIPRDAPPAKLRGARALGAHVVTYDRYREDRDQITAALADQHGYTVIPSADHLAVMAGAGTVALELLRQAPGLAVILVPVGGGLAAGTAIAAKTISGGITVIGVEPQTAADTAASLRAGHRLALPGVPDTIADGLRHTTPAGLPWQINQTLLDDVVTVSDHHIARAMRWAFDHVKIVAEPSGATALAAVTSPDLPPGPIGVVISGGSVDYGTFRAITGGHPREEAHAVA
jgi:threonine dehydratase